MITIVNRGRTPRLRKGETVRFYDEVIVIPDETILDFWKEVRKMIKRGGIQQGKYKLLKRRKP